MSLLPRTTLHSDSEHLGSILCIVMICACDEHFSGRHTNMHLSRTQKIYVYLYLQIYVQLFHRIMMHVEVQAVRRQISLKIRIHSPG
jgi:hypothetical protein